MTQFLKIIFWIVVIAAGIWLVDHELTLMEKNEEKELDNHLQSVCGVIQYEQPKNVDLFDSCMDAGYEEFAP